MSQKRPAKKSPPAEPWIAWRIHRRHFKILRIAAMTGADPDHVLASVCDWFRWVDSSCDSEHTGIPPELVDSTAGFNARRGKKTLAEAMADPDVGWITIEDGEVVVADFKRWFGQSARRRLTHARDVWLARNDGDKCAQDAHAGAHTVRTPSAHGRAHGSAHGAQQQLQRDLPVQSNTPEQNFPSELPARPQGESGAGSRGVWSGQDPPAGRFLPDISRCPSPHLEAAWAGREPPDSDLNANAVWLALKTLGVRMPAHKRLVDARKLTVPIIARIRSDVLTDLGAKLPLPVLIHRLCDFCGLPKSAEKSDGEEPKVEAWMLEIMQKQRAAAEERARRAAS